MQCRVFPLAYHVLSAAAEEPPDGVGRTRDVAPDERPGLFQGESPSRQKVLDLGNEPDHLPHLLTLSSPWDPEARQ